MIYEHIYKTHSYLTDVPVLRTLWSFVTLKMLGSPQVSTKNYMNHQNEYSDCFRGVEKKIRSYSYSLSLSSPELENRYY